MKFTIPKEIKDIAGVLEKAGYKAYLVGGCVRDLLLGAVYGEPVEPKDWDIATNAKPDEVQKLFSTFAKATVDKPATIYENQFGTVGVKTRSQNERLKIVEVTTFRIEGKYTDKRHPDEIKFAETIEEDLSRRDFTVNAIALNLKPKTYNSSSLRSSEPNGLKPELVDPYGGQKDLKEKIIRTVGNSKERFSEDALRLIRAVRLATELGFEVEKETAKAIQDEAGLLEMIAKERVRDELVKIIMAPRAAAGIIMLEDYKLLRYIMPELREGIGCGQNKHHIYTVFDHNVRALNYTALKGYSFHVRLASFLHDIGKPRTKRGEGPNSTFYNHEIVGARLTIRTLDRLHFSKDIVEKVAHLVRSHLFYYNVGEVTEGGVRRFLRRVGPENVDDLIKVREADRIGSGVPKAIPYKIRHLLFMIEKVKNDPISPKMLKIGGESVMKTLNIEPGPRIGQILSILLEEVLDDPSRNTSEYLKSRLSELGKLKEDKLSELSRRAQEKKEEFESGVEREIKKKYYVK